MSDQMVYLLAASATLLVWGAISFKDILGDGFVNYMLGGKGRQVLKGVMMAIMFIALSSFLSGCSGTYFNSASVYGGLDIPRFQSPQCIYEGPDNRSTSNLGAKINIYSEGRYRINGKYTHHSCAFNVDAETYDAIGIEFEQTIFERSK